MEQVVRAEMVASVHSLVANVGDALVPGDVLVILVSMKMEIPIMAPHAGTVVEILVAEGQQVEEGQAVATFRP
jgi:urea carboxylase